MYRKTDKLSILLKQNQEVFHIGDLGLLWQINNKNTLYTTIKRYVKRGVLVRVRKGLYAVKSLDQIDLWLLGVKHIHGYCYITTETVLAQKGVINQPAEIITLAGEKSIRFKLNGQDYRCRRLKEKFLYQMAGITEENGIKTASLERAVLDMQYFNSRFHFDGKEMIDWKKVDKLKKEVGYK